MADRTFWRIVRTNPPTERDFSSHAALGVTLRAPSPAAVRQSEGISVFAIQAQAQRQARRYPMLGRWLAELRIGDADDLAIERSPGGAGHHTIWGDARTLQKCVVAVAEIQIGQT